MNKQLAIKIAQENFLNCDGTFLEKCKLAKTFLDTVSKNGSLSGITHSKEWRQNRAKKLKDCCETCGSTDDLHISHTWHPLKREEMKEHVKRVHGDKLNSMTHEEERHSCPVCDSTSVKFLKTQQKWKCYAKRVEFKPYIQQQLHIWETLKEKEGVRDHFYQKFNVDTDEKVVGSIQGLGGTRKYCQNRHKVACGALFDKPNNKKIEKEIPYSWGWKYYYALENIAQTKRYIEMRDEDTLTECKKCGFERDKPIIFAKIRKKKEEATLPRDSLQELEALKKKYCTDKKCP